MWAYDNTQVVFSGGSIENYLLAESNSQVTISGGSIDCLETINNSQANISGGSGMLANGDAINNEFYLSNNSSIVFAPIPEPATLLLFGLGSLLIRKRK